MVSLLALASKPLYEREILALRSENESLKLQLFWKDFNVKKLIKMMRLGNSFPLDAPFCQCADCVHYKRATKPQKRGRIAGAQPISGDFMPSYDAKCSFGPWFAATARHFGLEIQNASFTKRAWPKVIEEHDANPGLRVLDMDCHLVNEDGPEWTHFTYGRKLWDAKRDDSPELLKLENLFEYLGQFRDGPGKSKRFRR